MAARARRRAGWRVPRRGAADEVRTLKLLAPLFLILAAGCSAQAPQRTLDSAFRLDDGVLVAKDGALWKPLIGKGYPVRVTDSGSGARPLTSFSMVSPASWWLTTPFEGYFSADQGSTWTKVLDRDSFKPGANLAALSASPLDGARWAAGTTFHGLWLSVDGGRQWAVQDDVDVAYPYNDGTREQINALAWSSAQASLLYLSVGKDGSKLWLLDTSTGKKKTIDFPGGSYLDVPEAIATRREGQAEILEVRTRSAWWRTDASGTWKSEPRLPSVTESAKTKRLETSRDKRAFYLTANNAGKSGQLEAHLDQMGKMGLNAVVIDFKNDLGEVVYDSQVPLAKTAKTVRTVFDAKDIVRRVHDKGFYLIARLVVFKDKRLYSYQNNKYALWDRVTKKPWGYFQTVTDADGTSSEVQKEFWVDSYSSDVWDYNVALARELQDLGVDEIQFDYIRFPSDGPVNQIVNRFKVEGMTRLDALESFLQRARAGVTIPISVDIYGYNGYFITDHLGQNLVMMSRYVDVISAMLYPSHFWMTFLPNMDYVERARVIYQDGSDRAWMNTGGRVNVRPWVQTFLIGGELKMTDARIAAYLDAQLKGVNTSKASGFLMWNQSNRYYMVTKPVN